MESALRPRDIQARIRSGESPEQVAQAAGTSVEAIMGFATPVLAERAHVAQTAQLASLRRPSGGPSLSARTLGQAAEAWFAGLHLHDEDVEWDAWRRTDGRWSLVARYQVEGADRTAELTHDVQGRYVVADNDEARMLTGEIRPPAAGSADPDAAGTTRRLSSVPRDQDELPLGDALGDDAIDLVRERPHGPADGGPVGRDAGPRATGHDEADEEPTGPVDGAAPVDEPVDTPVGEQTVVRTEDDGEGGDADAGTTSDRPARKRRGRASVPSWDEIMFGGGPGE